MAKQSKRARKFVTSGGVKARLEKGTITNKGKLQRKRKNSGGPQSEERRANKQKFLSDEEPPKKLEDEADFMSQANLGELDFDTFFSSAVEKLESKQDGDDDDEDDVSDAEIDDEMDEDDDDDDDDGDKEKDDDDNDNEEDEAEEKPAKKSVGGAKKKGKEADSDDSDNDSDSDDDDVEAAEQRMMKEMEKLQKSDPEFHSFLKQNEKSLLEFGDEDDEEDDDDDDDGEDEMDEDTKKDRKKDAVSPDDVHLTDKVLQSMELGAFEAHGIKSLRKLVAAYKSACHLSDPTSADDGAAKKQKGKKYVIDSSDIFDKLMILCLNKCHEEFRYHLVDEDDDKETDENEESKKEDDEEEGDDENKPINPKKLEKATKWDDLKGIIQSFFRSTFHVLTQGKEAELLTFVLKALSKYLRYLTPFPRLAQTCLKVLVSLWSAPLDQLEDYQVVRLNAFLRIRQMALTQPFPFIEDCLKKTYLAYAQRAKFGTGSSVSTVLPTLTFMGNCVVELYSLDYYSSYQHAFVYIRQLALLLRTAMQKKTPEAFQAVYCWQYVHSLKLWVAFLASTCQQNLREDFTGREEEVKHLRSLIYPLTEVIFGTIRLVSSTRYLPLRFHCVRLLQQLAATAEVYIPTTSILLDVLDLKELYLKPKKATTRNVTKGMQLALALKLAKDSPLRTSEELEACVNELFVLLNREVDLYRYSAGFPEFTVRICQQLRKFSKKTMNGRWRAYAKGCIDLCHRHAEWVTQKRSTLQEAPKDVKRLEVLKPTNEPSMGQRYNETVSKENRLESGSRPVASTAKLAGRGKDDTPADKDMEEDDAEDEGDQNEKSSSKKKRKKASKKDKAVEPTTFRAQQNPSALAQADEVAEGIDWSDED